MRKAPGSDLLRGARRTNSLKPARAVSLRTGESGISPAGRVCAGVTLTGCSTRTSRMVIEESPMPEINEHLVCLVQPQWNMKTPTCTTWSTGWPTGPALPRLQQVYIGGDCARRWRETLGQIAAAAGADVYRPAPPLHAQRGRGKRYCAAPFQSSNIKSCSFSRTTLKTAAAKQEHVNFACSSRSIVRLKLSRIY